MGNCPSSWWSLCARISNCPAPLRARKRRWKRRLRLRGRHRGSLRRQKPARLRKSLPQRQGTPAQRAMKRRWNRSRYLHPMTQARMLPEQEPVPFLLMFRLPGTCSVTPVSSTSADSLQDWATKLWSLASCRSGICTVLTSAEMPADDNEGADRVMIREKPCAGSLKTSCPRATILEIVLLVGTPALFRLGHRSRAFSRAHWHLHLCEHSSNSESPAQACLRVSTRTAALSPGLGWWREFVIGYM